jgi:hypothetical protein
MRLTNWSNRSIRLLFFAQKTHEHLLGKPVGKMHGWDVLGSARPLRTPANLIERELDRKGLEKLGFRGKK